MSNPQTAPARRWFNLLACLAFACSFVFIASRPLVQKNVEGAVRMRDFVTPYTGARCLLAHCNPYDLQQVKNEFHAAGGSDSDHAPWLWEPPVYPPSSLVVLLPAALFTFHLARALWFGFSLFFFSAALLAAALLVERRYRSWAILLAAGLLATRLVGELIGIGQPSALALGMAILALYLLLSEKFQSVATILLGMGLALKPQLAGVIFLLLVFRRQTKRPAIVSAILACVFMLVGVVWLQVTPASKSWLRDYKAQIASSVAEGVNNPAWDLQHAHRMLNLQASFAAVFDSPSIYDTLAWSLSLLLFAAWVNAFRKNSDSRELTTPAMAAIVCIGLLPVYHREYDIPILMLTFPALFSLVAHRTKIGVAALLITIPLLYSPFRPLGFMQHFGSAAFLVKLIPFARLRVLLFGRPQPLVILCLAVLYTFALVDKSGNNWPKSRLAAN